METIQDENREIWEVEIWEVPEEDVIAYLEEENKNNVNKEKQVDNWKVENE
jgi:hypothetical protein